MAFPVWVDNLIAYSLQIAILAAAGTLLAYIFRLRLPRVSLAYWQVLLLVCLLLPALQKWDHPVQYQAPAMPGAFVYTITETPVAEAPSHSFFPTPEIIGLVLGIGICLRLLWLAVGFFRLRLFLRKAKPLEDSAPVAGRLCSRIGVRVRFFLSHEIDSPATFGVLSPTVILPGSFSGMSEACREAVVCHELLHVRRRDWPVIFLEEIIRSLYWFHPAVWWLLGRIHVAREQSVDHEVVRLTGSRQPYLDSLLEIARSRGRPKAVPAPLFLKERHLVERVALLLKEVSMNRYRLAVSLAGIAFLLAGTVLLGAGWFPLTGEPKIVQQQPAQITPPAPDPVTISGPAAPSRKVELAANTYVAAPPAPPSRESVKADEAPQTAPAPTPVRREPIRVGGNIQESKLIRKVEPVYPQLALKSRVSGRVVLMVTVDEEGSVSDIQVQSGHPLLSEAAVTAVRQWKYSPTLLNGEAVPVIATVTVIFAIDGVPPPSDFGSVPPPPAGAQGLTVMRPDGLGGFVSIRATATEEKGPPPPDAEPFHAPELAVSQELFQEWHRTAEAGWPPDVAKNASIAYMFIVDEVGDIKNLVRVQGPEIPGLERELSQLRVVSPGLRGTTPIRSLCVITINLGVPGGIVGGVIPNR